MKTITYQGRKWDIIARQYSSRNGDGIIYTLKLHGRTMRDVRDGDVIAVHEDEISDDWDKLSSTIKLVVNR